jgi:hypothetical protein
VWIPIAARHSKPSRVEGVENDDIADLDAFQRVGLPVPDHGPRIRAKIGDGADWLTHPPLYGNTAGRAGVAYSGTHCATAARNRRPLRSQSRAAAEGLELCLTSSSSRTPHRDQNELANKIKHEGIRVGEHLCRGMPPPEQPQMREDWGRSGSRGITGPAIATR